MKIIKKILILLLTIGSAWLFLQCESATGIQETNIPGYTDSSTGRVIPSEHYLHRAYPNPFKDKVNIRIDIPGESKISLVVQNPLGDVVKVLFFQNIDPGYWLFEWDGTNDDGNKVKKGKYFITLESKQSNFGSSTMVKFID
jgi:hypothetical protein